MAKTIGLVIGVLLLAGFGFYAYSRRKQGLSVFGVGRPPLYAAYGPGAQNPKGPPAGRASIGSTLQDATNIINGGDKLLMAGKNAWDDISGLFANNTDDGNTVNAVTDDSSNLE